MVNNVSSENALTMDLESDDSAELKYEVLGKLLQSQKEGLAKLEREEGAKKARKKDLKKKGDY